MQKYSRAIAIQLTEMEFWFKNQELLKNRFKHKIHSKLFANFVCDLIKKCNLVLRDSNSFFCSFPLGPAKVNPQQLSSVNGMMKLKKQSNT